MPRRLLDPEVRGRIWHGLSVWVVFLAVVIGVALGGYGIWVIHQTHEIVVSHNQELAQTKALAKQILQIEKQSSSNHDQTLIVLNQLCAALHASCAP
jgi:hypothetical protein